jgi:ABC-type multidrug transport system fused ATPase/permease subunit
LSHVQPISRGAFAQVEADDAEGQRPVRLLSGGKPLGRRCVQHPCRAGTSLFTDSFLPLVALIFWIGSRWLVDLRYSVNDFFVILQASVFGATQAGGVFAFVPDASKAQQAATDVIRLLDQRPKIDLESTEGKVSHAAARGHLRFDNVSFGYVDSSLPSSNPADAEFFTFSATLLAQDLSSCVTSPSTLPLGPTSLSSVPPVAESRRRSSSSSASTTPSQEPSPSTASPSRT